MDFPQAWTIARSVVIQDHEELCSYRQTCGGLLCDCKVITGHPDYAVTDTKAGE